MGGDSERSAGRGPAPNSSGCALLYCSACNVRSWRLTRSLEESQYAIASPDLYGRRGSMTHFLAYLRSQYAHANGFSCVCTLSCLAQCSLRLKTRAQCLQVYCFLAIDTSLAVSPQPGGLLLRGSQRSTACRGRLQGCKCHHGRFLPIAITMMMTIT